MYYRNTAAGCLFAAPPYAQTPRAQNTYNFYPAAHRFIDTPPPLRLSPSGYPPKTLFPSHQPGGRHAPAAVPRRRSLARRPVVSLYLPLFYASPSARRPAGRVCTPKHLDRGPGGGGGCTAHRGEGIPHFFSNIRDGMRRNTTATPPCACPPLYRITIAATAVAEPPGWGRERARTHTRTPVHGYAHPSVYV